MTTASYTFPSSLQASPVKALVPPGQCQFGESFTSAPLLERTKVSPTSSVLRFGLPVTDQPLNLSTCACILANANIDGNDVTRPYTPISTNQQTGSFDLLVKDYGPEHGTMSHYLCSRIAVGDQVSFKHIAFNVKTQAPFQYDQICMLVGGTGITPFIQALHAILGDESSPTPRVTMLYGSKFANDILGYELLHKWATEYPDRFELVDILSDEPADTEWKGLRGHVTRELVEKYFPSPSSDSNFQVWICGPPPMYNALTGPREDKDVIGGLLGTMGYSPSQVYKF